MTPTKLATLTKLELCFVPILYVESDVNVTISAQVYLYLNVSLLSSKNVRVIFDLWTNSTPQKIAVKIFQKILESIHNSDIIMKK